VRQIVDRILVIVTQLVFVAVVVGSPDGLKW
jgi:hypothetical protein